MSSAVEVPSIHPPKISGDQRQFSSLSPVTEERLLQFYGRQRRQTVLRALGWMVSALVALMLISVLVDATVYHSSTRWWLAGMLIGSMLIGLLAFCVRPLLGRPQWTAIASNMEKLRPELRNQLLSAVELASQPLVNDSLSFRHQVQRSAAIAVGPIDVNTLLPSRLIRKPLFAGLASTLAVMLLCFVPQLKMPQRLLRVLLPWANIGRITFVSIHVESPDVLGESSKLVFPRGEMTGVVAKVDGPKPSQVFLEWRLPNGNSPTSLEMSLIEGQVTDRKAAIDEKNKGSEGHHFETVFPIEDETLEFRVVASGAETAWYTLTTIPRPRVESFEITVTPPEYTQLPMRQFSAETADLAALEGSNVRVSLNTNPPALDLRGQVNWLSRSAPSNPSPSRASAANDLIPHQPLIIDSKQRLFVDFPADGDREFKFDLQHLASGIKNDFSPTYRARVIRDLPPQVAWVWPTSPSVLLNHQELLGLKLVARDEFAVDKWIGRYQINSQDWVHVDLSPSTTKSTSPISSSIPPRSDLGSEFQNTEVDWLFDLSKLQLQEGDIVEVQVSAMDRKQQETVSSALRVMISALQWDLKPSQLELERQRIKSELVQLVEKFKPIDKQIDELRKSKDLASSDALQQLADHLSQVDQLSRLNLSKLRESIEQLLREPQDRVTQHELRGLGQWLEKLDNQTLPALEKLRETTANKRMSSEFAQANEEKLRGQLVFPLADSTRQMIAEVSQMAEGFHAVVDSDAARRISMQSNRLAKWVKQLEEESKSASIPVEVLNRRREIVVQHIKQLSEALIQTGESSGKQLENLARGIGQQVDQLVVNVERSSPSFKDSAASIQQVMSNIRTQLSASMNQQANQGRRRATLLAGSSGERFSESLRTLDNGSLQASAQTEKTAERLHDLRSLHIAGDTADRQFGGDLGNAQRALSYSLSSSASTQEQAKEVRQVADAVKKLEAVHALEQANNSLNQLLLQEGQSQYLPQNLIEHPRVWDDYAEQLERTVRLMREAQIPGELVSKAEQLQWNQSASQASEKINERMWSNEPPVSAKPQLLQLSQTIQELREQMNSIAKAARESLQQRTPTLGELAQNAAQSSAELVDQTEQLSEQLEENKVPDSTARLESLKKAVEPATKPLQDLKEALVDLAGSQDLLDSEQLQQAKKADAALDVVNKAEKQLNQSLDAVKPAASPAQDANQKLAKDLVDAAKKQTDVSAAMRNLAEYFDKDVAADRTNASPDSIANDSSKETAESSDQPRLEDIAKSLNEGLLPNENGEADSQEASVYEQAQRLSQIAGLTPEQMLKSLEKQLKNSPSMQAEMSEIASDAAEQALRQLDRSQKRQEAMSTQLEQSDPRTRNQKVLLAHDLTSARNEAGNLLQQLLTEANSAAAAGQSKENSSKLQETAQQLRQTLSQIPQVGAHNSIAQLQDAARKIGDALDQAHQQTTEIEASLAAAAAETVANQNGQQKDQQLRDAKSRRDRIKSSVERQADQFKQNLKNLAKSADDQKRQTEQEAKQRREQLSRIEKDLQKQPNNAALQDSVSRQKRELAMSEARVDASREFQEAIEKRKKSAEEFAEQVKKNAAPEINQPNPQVQLAQSLAQQAANASKQFAGQLDQWENWAASPEANEQELASQASQEANVQRQVQSAARDLARASRHESRLNQSANSAELNELAKSTQEVANQSLQQSRDQLSKAQESARSQERPTGQASSVETAASIAAIQNADQEIRKAANEVREMLDGKSDQSSSKSSSGSASDSASSPSEGNGSSSNSNSPSSSSNSSTPNAPFSPEQMAQMLDELDRQLNDQGQQQGSSQQQGSQGQQQQGQSQQGQTPGSSESAGASSGQTGSANLPTTLSQAAQQLAGQLSRQRQASSDSSGQSSNASQSSSSRQSAAAGQSNSSATSSGSTSSGAFAQSVPSDSVRVLSVPRTNEAWGELRKQEATETVETQRERGSNRYRRAIDAYFKALAESKSVSGGGSNDASKK